MFEVASSCPFIGRVPKDPMENVRWRMRMRQLALHDRELQRALYDASMADILFFFNAFCWLQEPRLKDKVIPFVTWPHQDPAILVLDEVITESEKTLEDAIDVVADKSRAQGATYLCLGIILRRWLRDPLFAACLVSRHMEAVDDTSMNSLIGKLDWMIGMLPYWMLPEGFNATRDRSYTKHAWVNVENEAFVSGSAATGDVFSGGRGTVVFFDEVAKFTPSDAEDAMNSTQHVANCRWFVSTHKSDSGVYFDMVMEDTWTAVGGVFLRGGSGVYRNSSGGVKIVLDWRDNPTQSRLSYVFRNHIAVAVDPNEQVEVNGYVEEIRVNGSLDKLRRRGFIKEGRQRSPWYDRQSLRKGATPRGIAQELDRDPRGTVGKVFNVVVLDRMKTEKAKSPVWEGKPAIVDGALRLVPQEEGPLKLWFRPGLDDDPPHGRFVVGADISTGSGGPDAANSALIGGNCFTGEQVLEYTDSAISETHFARLAVAICKWLKGALLIWEASGPTGKRFGNEVLKELYYGNVWMRPREDVRSHEVTQKAGWVNSKTSDKVDLFDHLWVAMDDELFTPRSAEFLKECGGWEWDGEKITYKGAAHGDRAIAGGLCWKGMHDLTKGGVYKQAESTQTAPVGSIAWHEEQDRIRARKKEGDDAVDFGVLAVGRGRRLNHTMILGAW